MSKAIELSFCIYIKSQ
ncbi:TPA: hypothetical protein ANIA_11450 [Aspergillus nidulans FGSC A4]|uniref:Uncharacterized protein n=1 Tax=Emericella nidulans (strain FGSC A4 / ATCC 38163 / CBS 112.46 / NRRL 194 / M139) TaxID=227321 RepID=C8V9E2_EMENI|nr:TPA: hypothetical protein ANIA_11450 [Aspergillus nidulans FGSC A4]